MRGLIVTLVIFIIFLSYQLIRAIDQNFKLQQKYEAGIVAISILEEKLAEAEELEKKLRDENKLCQELFDFLDEQQAIENKKWERQYKQLSAKRKRR